MYNLNNNSGRIGKPNMDLSCSRQNFRITYQFITATSGPSTGGDNIAYVGCGKAV